MERLVREGLKELFYVYPKLRKETTRYNSATCSCIVELREAITLSRIFRAGIFRGFSRKRISEAEMGEGARLRFEC